MLDFWSGLNTWLQLPERARVLLVVALVARTLRHFRNAEVIIRVLHRPRDVASVCAHAVQIKVVIRRDIGNTGKIPKTVTDPAS